MRHRSWRRLRRYSMVRLPLKKLELPLVTVRQQSYGKIMVSVVSICQQICPMGPLPMMHWPSPHRTPTSLLDMGPPRHGTWGLALRYVQTYSTWASLYKNPLPRTCSNFLMIKYVRLVREWFASF